MSLEIRIGRESDMEESFLDDLVSLINRVYAEAEDGMWQPGFKRVQKQEIESFIKDQKLIFAILDNIVVGSVFVTQINKDLGEFGMLVCDPKHRHKGIGRRLIKAAEDHCRGLGCAKMQLELLYPKSWPQPTKEILKVWYPKLGYIKGPEENFNRLYPQLAPTLATECVFSTYAKTL